MPVLTTDRKVSKRGPFGNLSAGPIAAGMIIPHGRPVFRDPNGLVVNTSNGGANEFAGIAHERFDNSGGADSDLSAEFWIRGRFRYPIAAASQADVGNAAFAIDNDELNVAAAGASRVGTITEYLSATEVEVDIDIQA